MKKTITLIILTVLITTSAFSQTNKKFIDTGSVKNQFDYLIDESYSYKDYKNIKLNWLTKLKANVSDSLAVAKKTSFTNLETIKNQGETIKNLNDSLVKLETTITTLTTEKQSISLFGNQLGKSFFKTLMFSIIGILIILLVFFISKFKQSNNITIHTKGALKEVEEEFDSHRKTALEREQKVMRKLQDELNKQKKE